MNAVSDGIANELNSKITGLMKSATATGATTAYGYLSTDINVSNRKVVFAYTENVAYHVITFVRSGKIEFYVTQVDTNGNCVAVKNTSVTVTYYYF